MTAKGMRIGPHKHTPPADRRFPDVSLFIHNGSSATSSRSLERHLVNSPKEDITDSAVSPPSPARNPPIATRLLRKNSCLPGRSCHAC